MATIEMRLRILDALETFLPTTPLSNIKVTDICRKTGIGRTSFYENFENVFAIPIWYWDYLMQQTLYQAGNAISYYEAHVRAFQAMRDHREFFSLAKNIGNTAPVVYYAHKTMGNHLADVYMRKTGKQLTEEQRLLLKFFDNGTTHTTGEWLEGGMVEEPEQMAWTFTQSLPAFIAPYLDADPQFVSES